MVLKNGAKMGLNLFEIGNIIFRDDDDEIPAVQIIIDKTF